VCVDKQSIHPAVIGHVALDARSVSTNSSMPPTRHGLLHDPRRRHLDQTHAHVEDMSGQAHSAIVALNSSGSSVREHGTIRPSATRSVIDSTMLPETTVAMVILAVDVGGDHSPERDIASTWRDRNEEAAREEDVAYLRQRQAGFGVQRSRLAIEGEDSIGKARAGHACIRRGRKRRVAIGTPEASCQRNVLGDPSEILRANFVAGHDRHTSPARQRHANRV
jgi:hypothetical protein